MSDEEKLLFLTWPPSSLTSLTLADLVIDKCVRNR